MADQNHTNPAPKRGVLRSIFSRPGPPPQITSWHADTLAAFVADPTAHITPANLSAGTDTNGGFLNAVMVESAAPVATPVIPDDAYAQADALIAETAAKVSVGTVETRHARLIFEDELQRAISDKARTVLNDLAETIEVDLHEVSAPIVGLPITFPSTAISIDPEDDAQVIRLVRLFWIHTTSNSDDDFAAMRTALRIMGEPRPEEPTNVGAIVEDDLKGLWARQANGLWRNLSNPGGGEIEITTWDDHLYPLSQVAARVVYDGSAA